MKDITASGVVTFRRQKTGTQVLVVHRPTYDDWTLPKGKVKPDEYLAACAARETLEETGVSVRLGRPINLIKYPVGGGVKTVHYWHGLVTSESPRKPDGEIDQVKWFPVAKALERLTYPDEKGIIDQALSFVETTPLLIVRHGKAMLRKNWSGADQRRPMTTRGRRQAQALVDLFEAYGVAKLASSSSTRCLTTLKPYAKSARLDIDSWAILSEEQGVPNPKGVAKTMARLAAETAQSRVPTAICGHRPVLGMMLEAVGIEPKPMQPAAVIVAHLAADGSVVAVETHKPRL